MWSQYLSYPANKLAQSWEQQARGEEAIVTDLHVPFWNHVYREEALMQ